MRDECGWLGWIGAKLHCWERGLGQLLPLRALTAPPTQPQLLLVCQGTWLSATSQFFMDIFGTCLLDSYLRFQFLLSSLLSTQLQAWGLGFWNLPHLISRTSCFPVWPLPVHSCRTSASGWGHGPSWSPVCSGLQPKPMSPGQMSLGKMESTDLLCGTEETKSGELSWQRLSTLRQGLWVHSGGLWVGVNLGEIVLAAEPRMF